MMLSEIDCICSSFVQEVVTMVEACLFCEDGDCDICIHGQSDDQPDEED